MRIIQISWYGVNVFYMVSVVFPSLAKYTNPKLLMDIYSHDDQDKKDTWGGCGFKMRETGDRNAIIIFLPIKVLFVLELKLYSIHIHIVWTYSSMLKIHS